MVSQRQRLAKKRFKDSNPDLFLKPEPSSETSKKIKKKKKKNFKKNKGKGVINGKSGSNRKHPLRIPGMRPGESCFICKSTEHIAKLCPEKAQWEKNKICLFCRKQGHSVKNCPDKGESNDKKFCYNCGGVGHSLSKCPKPLENGGTKFASCFICKERGHLSKNCPKNEHGIYPKGGCCKVCGGVMHLAKHCPNKSKGDFDDSHQNTEVNHESQYGLLNIRRGGDDLDDDFITQVEIKNTKTKKSNSESAKEVGKDEKNAPSKLKKDKQGPKVVNFFG